MNKINSLLEYFIPQKYNLFLDIDKPSRHFAGKVTIEGQSLGKTIKLNSQGLTIESVSDNLNNNPTYELSDNILTIHSSARSATIRFSGLISETAMNGLYLCKYKVDDQTKELFATQFEPHYARRVFPCIDEPAAKAVFKLNIKSEDPDDQLILSNMPGKLANGLWDFDETPKMSTYLLAFVGGNLISKTSATKRGTKVSLYATPAQPVESLDHALDVAISCVEFYEDYFGVLYPLPKLDNVALPDFSAGAMENWGLITYRETALLSNPNVAEDTKEYIATVVAHEIAHQWFGNLVTMEWWNNLWLNESFASLMEQISLDALHPEYKVWEDFETNEVPAALNRDALEGIQAVQQDVSSPEEIATLFDGAIVYAKGERLLKMLRAYIGETAFREGLKNYFRDHQYRNTTAEDLWKALSASSAQDISTLMNPWLSRPGYPVVRVSKGEQFTTISQKQFFLSGKTSNLTWPIPLFGNLKQIPDIINQSEIALTLESNSDLQLNINNNGHFITQYDDYYMNQLEQSLPNLSPIDQIKLVEESLLLSKSGLQDVRPSLALISQLKSVDNQSVISTVSGVIGSLSQLIPIESETEDKFKSLVRDLFSNSFSRIFNQSEPDNSLNGQKAAGTVLARSIYGNNPAAIQFARQAYSDNSNRVENIQANIRSTVLANSIRRGDKAIFSSLWDTYQNTQDPELKIDICSGLTSTHSHDQIDYLLNSVVDTSKVKPQDTFYFILWLLANPYSRGQAWRWIRDNWGWIDKVFSSDMSYDTFVRGAGNTLQTSQELDEYSKFFATINAPDLKRVIEVGANNITAKIDWIKRNKPVLESYLNSAAPQD